MLDDRQVEKIHKELNFAISEICKKYNLQFKPSTLRFTSTSIRMTVEANSINNNGEIVLSTINNAKMIGLIKRYHSNAQIPNKIIGNFFNVSDLGRCEIIDFKPNSKKYPFIVKTSMGSTYKVSPISIKF